MVTINKQLNLIHEFELGNGQLGRACSIPVTYTAWKNHIVYFIKTVEAIKDIESTHLQALCVHAQFVEIGGDNVSDFIEAIKTTTMVSINDKIIGNLTSCIDEKLISEMQIDSILNNILFFTLGLYLPRYYGQLTDASSANFVKTLFGITQTSLTLSEFIALSKEPNLAAS